MKIIDKVFGTHSERELKRIEPIIRKIEEYRPTMAALSDEELKAKTPAFKKMLEEGKTTDDILPEAYAVVREAAKRVLNQEHYRVQLIGGVILHQGQRSASPPRTGAGRSPSCPYPP